jgi:hypothetical protein
MVAAVPAMAADAGPLITYQPPPVNVYAPDPVSGYLEVFGGIGGWTYYEDGDTQDSGSITRLGGAGRLNWWVSPAWSVQGDVYGSGFDYDGDAGNPALGIAGHVTLRDPNSHALGVMFSVGHTALIDDPNRWGTLAVEGQLYMGNTTLYGQAGRVFSLGDCCGDDPGIWYAALQGRYFITPNFAAIGDLGFAHFSEPSSGDTDNIFRWGAGLEYKPDTMPVSMFARYQGEYHDVQSSWEFTVHEFLAGVKLFVNQPTLLANDRHGATLLDLNPQYGEFNSYFIE